MQRVRLTFSKGEELMYTGNLDMHKIWERTFRRAEINLAYSQGFHPQPRIQLACPLPLGFTGLNEILDFWVDSEESLAQLEEKLAGVIQPGIVIKHLEIVPLNSPALQTLVNAAIYQISFDIPIDHKKLQEKISSLLSMPTCFRERRGKKYDLHPLIKNIQILDSPKTLILEMMLVTLPGATGRPEEVLDALAIPITNVSILRSELVFSPEL